MSGPANQHDHNGRAAAAGSVPLFSVIVPLFNEEAAVGPLVADIEQACSPLGAFELILVDDASEDATREKAMALARLHPWLRVLGHDRRGGQSAAVHNGVRAAWAAIMCTLDGDGQNPPEEIAQLVAPLLAPDCPPALALVAGQRQKRRDSLAKRLASVVANRIRGAILRDGTRDTGCGLKAFRRDAFLALPYFDHMHRFLPALFARDGWQIRHLDVGHRPRVSGRSKYNNLARASVGVIDLAGVAWLMRRRMRTQAMELDAGAMLAWLDTDPQQAQHPVGQARESE